MLRKTLNISWREHVRNELLYGDLPKISTKIRTRRLKLAGHSARHPEEAASNLVLWVPDKGSRRRGRPTGTFIDTLMRDTGLQLEEILAKLRTVENRCSSSWNELDIVIVVVVVVVVWPDLNKSWAGLQYNLRYNITYRSPGQLIRPRELLSCTSSADEGS